MSLNGPSPTRLSPPQPGSGVASESPLRIEICLLDADAPRVRTIELPAPACVAQAIEACPELISPAQVRALAELDALSAADWAAADLTLSIFGQRARLNDPLHDHDRIELLPGLRVDPKVARARRAEHRRRTQGERRWARDRALPRGEPV
jgi:putative ubiquitin-RnfH superfamily antitoxin RatB of RatAB toxin-antitoxin module